MPFYANYLKAQKKIETLLNAPEDRKIKSAVLKNLKEIRSWLPANSLKYKPNNKMHQAAVAALESTLSILDTLELLNSADYQTKDQDLGPHSLMHHLFQGGHLLIEDEGALLEQLKSKGKLVARYSSHYKNQKLADFKQAHQGEFDLIQLEKAALNHFNQAKPDFSIKAELVFNEFLIGEIKINGKKHTWLQFEGHSHQARTSYTNVLVRFLDSVLQCFHYSLEKFQHHLDFLNYLRLGKKQNIGQYGNSFFTESSPIRMKKTEPVLKEEEADLARISHSIL